jgi:hypothetical protein
VQYNDPDALLWIFIYVVAALVSFLCAINKISAVVPLAVGALALIGFLYLYPSDFQGFEIGDGAIETVELGREAFALLIMAIVFLLFGFRLRRKSKV